MHQLLPSRHYLNSLRTSIPKLLPCLTVCHLDYVDLNSFDDMDTLFPTVHQLELNTIRGPILDLVQACSKSLEELRLTCGFAWSTRLCSHDRISLPKLQVLVINGTMEVATAFPP